MSLGKLPQRSMTAEPMTRANRSSLWFGMAGSDDSTLTTKSIAPSRPVVSGVLSNVAFVGCFVRFIIWPPLRRLTLTLILYDRNGRPQRFVGQFEPDIDSSRNAGEDAEGTWFSTSE